MVISDPQHTQCSNLTEARRWAYGHNIYLQSHSYHHNGFVATHAFGHMMSLNVLTIYYLIMFFLGCQKKCEE